MAKIEPPDEDKDSPRTGPPGPIEPTATLEATASDAPSSSPPSSADLSKQENASIRQAFLREGTTLDFLSAYGRNPKFTQVVHNIGTYFSYLADARSDYL